MATVYCLRFRSKPLNAGAVTRVLDSVNSAVRSETATDFRNLQAPARQTGTGLPVENGVDRQPNQKPYGLEERNYGTEPDQFVHDHVVADPVLPAPDPVQASTVRRDLLLNEGHLHPCHRHPEPEETGEEDKITASRQAKPIIEQRSIDVAESGEVEENVAGGMNERSAVSDLRLHRPKAS
jgi:hypothetical protein